MKELHLHYIACNRLNKLIYCATLNKYICVCTCGKITIQKYSYKGK